jgi:succinyl-CoA synthetase alpha subunit
VAILVNKDTRVLVQGITGAYGGNHARWCMEYGTKVVAGVTPGKGGQKFDDKVPVFNTVADAVKQTGADASMIFVPPPFARCPVRWPRRAVRRPARGAARAGWGSGSPVRC